MEKGKKIPMGKNLWLLLYKKNQISNFLSNSFQENQNQHDQQKRVTIVIF